MYGEMMILTFEDSEEEILNRIISYVSTGARAFQVAEIAKTNFNFNGLEIDITKRLVRKQRLIIEQFKLNTIKIVRYTIYSVKMTDFDN
ncbi:MAG: hypothetical protein SOY47_13145 [Lachnospiraceae bacterium]|nr:hypothetical protein [Lachnospiraceae bacterium]